MSPSASDHAIAPARFVIVGNPGSRRVELFQAALAGLGLSPACVVAYADLLSGHAELADFVWPGDIVRFESPGKDFAVERLLLSLGADAADDEDGFARISRFAVERLTFDKGLILYPRQWYLGFCAALRLIERQLAACPGHLLMNRPAEIAVMFDKRRCHERMLRSGVCVPRSLGPVASFEELRACMQQTGCSRVFVKLAHGSSASGVVAYQVNNGRHHAATTVEVVRRDGALCLYNSRRLRLYQDAHEIAELIDALCRQRVHVEQWLPKAGIDNQVFDLRVVVIAGRARHVVVRQGQKPMTNLHLLNTRGNLDAVLARLGPARWQAARDTCQLAMGCFPDSLYAGIDLMFTSDFRRHAVLEINAFGDLLPGVLWEGQDTYTAETMAMVQ